MFNWYGINKYPCTNERESERLSEPNDWWGGLLWDAEGLVSVNTQSLMNNEATSRETKPQNLAQMQDRGPQPRRRQTQPKQKRGQVVNLFLKE